MTKERKRQTKESDSSFARNSISSSDSRLHLLLHSVDDPIDSLIQTKGQINETLAVVKCPFRASDSVKPGKGQRSVSSSHFPHSESWRRKTSSLPLISTADGNCDHSSSKRKQRNSHRERKTCRISLFKCLQLLPQKDRKIRGPSSSSHL